jgi:hypothetical protein
MVAKQYGSSQPNMSRQQRQFHSLVGAVHHNAIACAAAAPWQSAPAFLSCWHQQQKHMLLLLLPYLLVIICCCCSILMLTGI